MVDDALEEINQTLGVQNGLSFKSFKWEKDVLPSFGKDPQDVINDQAQGYDYFVGLMWKKFGYPTPRAASPSIEEYEDALKNYKSGGTCKGLAMFFCTKDVPFSELKGDALSQIEKVNEFKEKVSKDGGFYKEYNGPQEFSKLFRVTMFSLFSKAFCVNHYVKKPLPSLNNISRKSSFDKNAKILFDSLSMNVDVSMFKTSFIESCIYLYLYEAPLASAKQIIEHLGSLLSVKDDTLYNKVLSRLNQSGYISNNSEKPKLFNLSDNIKSQITKIKKDSEENEKQLLDKCDVICKKYELKLDFSILKNYVLALFDRNYDLDTSELSRGIISKENNIKRIFGELETYIRNESGLPHPYVTDITKELLDVFCNNPTLYKCSTSKMFLSLFQNDQLEEYMSNTNRHLIFDTQVLLRLICVINDRKDMTYADPLYMACKDLWTVIRKDTRFIKHTTCDYIEEVTDHLVQARDLSKFLNLSYIRSLGPSKNVFFNHYLSVRDTLETGTFDEYTAELLGIEESIVSSIRRGSLRKNI